MDTQLAIPKGWIHHNQALAKQEFRRRLNKDVVPQLFLHTYKNTNFKCLSWECEGESEDDRYMISVEALLNNALLFWDEEECIPLHDGSLFQMNGDFYLVTEDKKNGLSIKRVDMICTQEMISRFCNNFDMQGFEFVFCKAYQVELKGLTFIGYVWSGFKEDGDNHYRTILPLFCKDFRRMYTDTSFWDWEFFPMEAGETIRHNNTVFVVKENKDGIYIDKFATLQFNKNRKP